MPWDTVEEYVRYYRALRENTKPNDNVLWIQYEDLIYDYYRTSKKVMDYLGYKERPQNEFQYFDPDISVRYTNLKSSAINLERDILYIEKELKEYLYPFPDKYSKR